MDYTNIFLYVLVALVGLYFLKNACGISIPLLDQLEPFDNELTQSDGAPSASTNQVVASEKLGNNAINLPVKGINRTPTSCYPQNTLKPEDLLPTDTSKAVKDFENANPTGEGILKGVNFLDAGFHVGVNTVGQSLRNANRQLRSEPPNPQVAVSPWLNTTIGPDLQRKPLEDEDVCTKGLPQPNNALNQIGQSA
tara:strand:+ start:40 stop:624 length:585 start_codon:yes stop_codon:yes gene_type:complete